MSNITYILISLSFSSEIFKELLSQQQPSKTTHLKDTSDSPVSITDEAVAMVTKKVRNMNAR